MAAEKGTFGEREKACLEQKFAGGDGRNPWRGRGWNLAVKLSAYERVEAFYNQRVSSLPPALEASPHLIDEKTEAREAESVLLEVVLSEAGRIR